MDIKLGQKVKDKITGFVGVVDHIVYNLYDAKKIGIQAPVMKDGKMGECYVFDVHGIEVLQKKPVVEADEPKAKYKLGSKAKCSVTGFKGTITGYAAYLNGCIRYKIQPEIPAGKKAEDFSSQYMPEGSVEIIEPPKEKKEPQRVGGPKERVERAKW